MMDSYVTMREGEKEPIYGSETLAGGTLTISGTPTVTVYDRSETPIPELTDVACTGYDSGAAETVRVWYDLDLTAPVVLTPGHYIVRFNFTAIGSDGHERRKRPTASIDVRAVTG